MEQGLEVGSSATILGQRVQAAVAAGTVEHDAALAEKCLKPIIDAAKLDDGEDCFNSSQCKSGACIETASSGVCFDTDEPCTSDADCDVNDFCDLDFSEVCGSAADVQVEICDGK